ncbi:hypothetical protein A2313_00670 [Candidatus Roizmanbacteria bacterium RIFOXYB2_FULL_41_10]|uniref:Murein biosynthesis integral membrane protein MurJ n=1 Tax=Candidatus Roizmanbacteria bacterium RIFOXYA1_FULL_41_12 TaxID=1802082 RepID=A0A1F7KAG8_9BACT|nr:MAG: hypothetical protein A2209_04050 [Candidatus Roizmanbacteria bacterium RIFOXYA1_FULL_41_12]OGK65030.1 MAG: hypothetical protein A2262_03190 [Candidatus Roizmanbacteria bacterium RIFOXYA2_FULL_41_8]OGK66893.1 MAG: hypothetical protein A2377_03275 [Candidatus Roizmanbacteria bacterium RIFOXYB1_FULL_41_27]OGK70733.1 MAG: hypothetical protein A2403_01430 [Candidatus Roizmanbacteria bacterium RIFOXYC1_FULL_41_16]OGK71474.1 MAG: hypothetical protein A2313_00670 [Candidatus Roizmanbacteria bac
MKTKSIAITLIFIISTFVQLVGQIVITNVFGAGFSLDTFLAAVVIPTTVVTVIYGTLNDAFLPYLGRMDKSKNQTETYFFSVVFKLVLFSLLLIAFRLPLSTLITKLIYSEQTSLFQESVRLQMSYLFISFPFAILSTLLGTYFYVQKKFLRFPLVQLMGNVLNLSLIIIFADRIGSFILIIGFLASIIFQVLLLMPKIKFKFSFWQLIKASSLKPIFFAWIPLIIGNFALRSDTLLIRTFGSTLESGSLVYLNIIAKFFALATGVITIGLQVLLLPRLVELLKQKKYADTFSLVRKSKLAAFLATLIVVGGLAIIIPFLVQYLFVGGRFTETDAQKTIALIPYFILPGLGWGMINIFFQPLLALRQQPLLGILNVVALSLAIAIGKYLLIALNPLVAISGSLIILLFVGIIGSEILWQREKQKLTRSN